MTSPSDGSISVAEYLLKRLSELGVGHIFTLPGSYVVGLLRSMGAQNLPTAVVTASEQEAAYAADAYAKTKGYGVVCCTYGVGSMSAMNGLVGSYVERCPVILINGGPSPEQRRQEIEHGILFLHSAGRVAEDYEIFRRVAAAAEIISDAAHAPARIDRALEACMTSKRPVYIEINQDIWTAPCPPPGRPLRSAASICDPETLAEAIQDCVDRVKRATNPILWGGEEIQRFELGEVFEQLVKTSGLPYVTTLSGKAIISEATPGYIGIYDGKFANESVQTVVARADLIIAIGTVVTDIVGNIVSKDYGAMIIAARDGVRVGHHLYQKVPLDIFLPRLSAALDVAEYRPPVSAYPLTAVKGHAAESPPADAQTPITFDSFFVRMADYAMDKLVVPDSSFCLFAAAEIPRAEAGSFVAQGIWLAIGYSIGAALGAALGTNQRVVAFTGDGGFREGPQAISTLSKCQLPVIICLMNNGVLGIEQFLTASGYFVNDGTKLDYYNQLSPWDYGALAKAFNADYTRIATIGDLECAIAQADDLTDRPILFDVILDPADLPGDMRKAIPAQIPAAVRRNFDFPIIPRYVRREST
jgi:indolepyruvate decarboxylase